jgi:RNA polymerase sigma-70 factor (ECF subfamily)
MTIEKFKTEVLQMKHKLFRFALRLLQSSAEAEDTVQEVFIRLWVRRDKLEDYKSIEAFAMTITRNLCLDKIKSKKNNMMQISDKDEHIFQHSPHDRMEYTDSCEKIEKIINSLPEHQKAIIQLRDVEGYDFDEIEKILELNKNYIRVNLSRARKKVRELMKIKYDYEFTKN